MRKFIIVKNVKVDGINAKSSDITVGMPPATTFCGLGETMSIKTGIVVKAVSYGSVKFEVRGSRFNTSVTKFAWQDRGNGGKANNNSPIQPKPLADGVFTLCFEVEWEDCAEVLVDKVTNFINTARIAGGTIASFNKPFVKVAKDAEELASVKNAMMPCYVVVDCGVEVNIFEDAVNRKLQPMVNGYKKLEKIVDNKHMRDKFTPVYLATPTYTMIGYKMVSNVDNFDQALWQYGENTKVKTIGGIYND